MDIAEFLLARIAEDEAEAMVQVAAHPDAPRDSWLWDRPQGDDDIRAFVIGPARVLAECEAKRRIVEGFQSGQPQWPSHNEDSEWEALKWAIKLLALPYSDHPDYDPAWSLTSATA